MDITSASGKTTGNAICSKVLLLSLRFFSMTLKTFVTIDGGSCTYAGMVTLRRDILVVFHPFMTHHFYCSQDCTEECAQAEGRWMLPLVILAWETLQKTTLIHSGWHQRRRRNQTKVLVVRNKVNLGCHEVYPWCISTPHQW